MTPDQQAILAILNNIPIDTLFWLSIKVSIIFMFVIGGKNLLESTVDYFMLRGNKFVSIGTNINIDQFTGKIKSIGIKTVVIENDKGYYVVQTRGWEKHNWTFIKTNNCEDCDKQKKTI